MARSMGDLRGFKPGDLQQYMNPYTEAVLGQRKRAIGEEYGRQAGALSTSQAAMDAFRSGRSDLARSRLDATRMRALDEATAQTQSEAFDRALQAYQQGKAQDIGLTQAQIGALAQTGGTERGIEQARKDFQYGQFLERRDWDVNNLGTLLQAIQATEPTAGTTKETKEPKKSPWGALLGIAGTAVGSMFGVPQLGGAIGSGLGGMIDG